MDGLGISEVMGGVVSLLLSIVAYFLKMLIQDIGQLKKDQLALRELCLMLKSDQNRIWDWLESKRQRHRSNED
jgi:hypothetical protein